MGKLDNKVAIITGASSGIGKDTSILFTQEGAKVLLVDLDVENGQKLKDKLNIEKSDVAEFVQRDVSNNNDWINIVKICIKKFGKIDILFNNAGIMMSSDGTLEDTNIDVWNKTINVNLTSVYLGCKNVMPFLIGNGGVIINTASFVGLMGSAAAQIAYTASKGGVISLSQELAAIYAKNNVRVVPLCPGPLHTELLMKFLDTDEKKQRRLVHLPMGRLG